MGMGMAVPAAIVAAALGAANWFGGQAPRPFHRADSIAQQPAIPQPRVLDNFDAIAGWGTFPSDGVGLRLSSAKGATGNAMQMAFDFRGKAGYAIARKAFAVGTPDGNWAFSFKARGQMRANTLEFKLLDKSGDNVWWYTIRDFRPTAAFQTIAIRQRQVSFAWGPIGGGPPRDIAAIEIVVTAGNGGSGTLVIDDLSLTALPVDVPVTAIATTAATSTAQESRAEFATDSDSNTVWRANILGNGAKPSPLALTGGLVAPPSLTLDLGGIRTYGGMVIHWAPNQHARFVNVDSSNDGRRWQEAGRLIDVRGGKSYLPITDGSSRYLRLRLTGGLPANGQYGIRTVSVKPLEFAASPTALLTSIARESRRGDYPRSLLDEQIYWAVVGISGGRSEVLLSEDGQLELAKRGPSLEPFLSENGRLISWASVTLTQSLLDSVRPVPSVEWTNADLSLTVTAFAAGTTGNSSAYARYRIVNRSSAVRTGKLFLALRPLQVNPPWQFLNTPGGAARVDSISWNGRTLRANASLDVTPLTRPVQAGVSALDAGEAISWIIDGEVPTARRVVDHRALASAVIMWNYNIAPGDSADFVVESNLDGRGDPKRVLPGAAATVARATSVRLRDVANTWARDQDAVTLHLPREAPPLVNAIKANLAWILINRDGPGIQPGSRSYERSWIRDGSLTAEALLRLGRSKEAIEFADWYAKFQYPNGKVPCCVDARGADPVDEHDSHGQLIHLIHEVWRYTGDQAFAKRMWPHVVKSIQYMDSLRGSHRTAEYDYDTLRTSPFKAGGRDSLYIYRGLLPRSISHEGYSAKPMHSVWDDTFGLLGYREAIDLAEALGNRKVADAFRNSLQEFQSDFRQAVWGTMDRNRIPYIPGSIELADFDATSTTTLLSPGDATGMNGEALRETFQRYYQSSRNRSRSDSLWENYTPYEWRTVGAMLRIGMLNEAVDMLKLLMRDRRPTSWQQWAEVVWREPRNPKFIGDMPHTWVGSDFIRSALDLFAYRHPCSLARPESTSPGSYFPQQCAFSIGNGIPSEWLQSGDSVVVRGLKTGGVSIGYTLKKVGAAYVYEFDDALRASDMFVFPPLGLPTATATVDGVVQVTAYGQPAWVPGKTRRVVFNLR